MENNELEKDPKLEKYREIVSDIESLIKNIQSYQKGDLTALGDEPYPIAVSRLYSLRCRQRSTKKSIRKQYDDECL